jgi:hypothetical protein
MPRAKLALRVICVDVPEWAGGFQEIDFGLQDKNLALLAGDEIAPQQRAYSVSVEVEQAEEGLPNFKGPFVHGTPKDRFLYLTLKGRGGDDDWQIIKRIKISLKPITWAQVAQVLADEHKQLEVSVSGAGAASVPLLGAGWLVSDRAL